MLWFNAWLISKNKCAKHEPVNSYIWFPKVRNLPVERQLPSERDTLMWYFANNIVSIMQACKKLVPIDPLLWLLASLNPVVSNQAYRFQPSMTLLGTETIANTQFLVELKSKLHVKWSGLNVFTNAISYFINLSGILLRVYTDNLQIEHKTCRV